MNFTDLGKNKGGMTISDKIDRIVTNRFLALPIFAAIMFVVYYVSISTVGTGMTDWVNDTLFGEWIIPGSREILVSVNCAEWLMGLVVDGIISGVGAVLGFLPQMLVLFIFLASLKPAATWQESPLLWTGFSASLAFRASPLSRCLSARAAAFPALWQAVQSKTNVTAE